jgi:diguanylate cyclase
MGFFRRNKEQTSLPIDELERQFTHCNERMYFYLQSIRTLCYFIKEFSLDITELDAESFKEHLDRLVDYFHTEEKIKRLEEVFTAQKEEILSYIDREKAYFQERDAEFKNIIAMLTTSIASLSKENQEFNTRLYTRSLQLEQITQLNDIRKIKEELKQEVEQIKQYIQQKQEQDAERLARLSQEMKSLQMDFEKAKNDSLSDGLTGAFNRLAFDSYIKKLIDRNAVTWTPFALLLIDVDNFKQINDTYGHRVGGRVLIALVQHCRRAVRQDDFISRYGGEEFVIVLPNTPLRTAWKKAYQMCKTIAATTYTMDEIQPGQKLSFTVSIGVSSFQEGDTIASVTERADKALYQAKHQGKNQAVSEKDLR